MSDHHPRCSYLWSAGFVLGLILASGVVVPAQIPGYPANIHAYDAREVAMLPRYCIYTQSFRETVPGGSNEIEVNRWYSLLGKSFHDLHHYCWGLMKTHRAIFLARNRQDRQFYLNDALSEFDYVIHRASADFVLLPEILTRKAENLLRLGRVDGIAELHRAITLKPDYWPPYAVLSDHFKQINDLAKAREWVEKGLLASPESKALQQRMVELGGGRGPQSVPMPRTKPRTPEESDVSTKFPQLENPASPVER